MFAAYGNGAPGNLITGFGFYNPWWLVMLANLAIVIHLIGGYQVWTQVRQDFLPRGGGREGE